MKYTLVSRNKSFAANSDEEFVRWMRKSDLQNFSTNTDFMEAYSYRKQTFENIELRFDNENNFVADLRSNNLLKTEENKKWNLFGK